MRNNKKSTRNKTRARTKRVKTLIRRRKSNRKQAQPPRRAISLIKNSFLR
jgi:hypothetical protein